MRGGSAAVAQLVVIGGRVHEQGGKAGQLPAGAYPWIPCARRIA